MNKTIRQIVLAAASVAVAGGAIAALPAAALASSVPTVGVGVQLMDTSIVHFPTNTLDPYQSEPDGDIGTTYEGTIPDPMAPGTSRTYHVQLTNAGNVDENLSVVQETGGYYNFGGASVPSSWISLSSDGGSIAPGAKVDETVTVSIPDDATPGLYGGVVMGTATDPTASGQILNAVGAGIREYITVS